jgi:hypothetical protein
MNIDSDYFARSPSIASPVFSEIDFERRMRMPSAIFERLRLGLLDNPYFMECQDETGKRGACTNKKMLAASLQKTDGISASYTTSFVRLASSTAAECLKEFETLLAQSLNQNGSRLGMRILHKSKAITELWDFRHALAQLNASVGT